MGAAKIQYQEMHSLHYGSGSAGGGSGIGGGGVHALQLQHDGQEGEYFDDEETRRATRTGTTLPSFTTHEVWVIRVLILWVITLSGVCFVPMTRVEQANIIGLVVNVNLVVFYGAPLSTIIQVWRTRNSSSIHRRTLSKSVPTVHS